jgi:WD40 repeat protein
MKSFTFAALCMGAFASSLMATAQEQKQERLTLRGHKAHINGVAFSPDGKTLASAGRDANIQIWDVATGKNIATLEGHTKAVWRVAFSPDGKTLASIGGLDRTLRVWDLATRKNTSTLDSWADPPYSIVFADQKTVVFGTPGKVMQWDLVSPKAKLMLVLDSGATSALVANTKADLWALGGGDSQSKSIWNVSRKKMTGKLEPIPSGYDSAAFSPDGTTLATGDNENPGSVDLWECATAKCKATYKFPAQTTCVAFSPDGEILAVSYKDKAGSFKEGNIRLVAMATGKEIVTFKQASSVVCLAFSPDGKTLASGSIDMAVRLFDVPMVKKAEK